MNNDTFKTMLRRSLVVGMVASSLAACDAFDQYAVGFARVAIGDSRSHVEAILGRPNYIGTIEVPMVRIDSLAWKSYASGHTYLVFIVVDRVVAKSAVL